MGTKTVHTLAYKLFVDSHKFQKGIVATRSELNQAKRAMKDLLTPAERIEIEFAKLGKLLKKGAIDQELWNRKAEQLRKEYDEATGAAQKRRDAEEKLRRTMERGAAVTRKYRTAEEIHNDTIREHQRLLEK